jgi:hypothetical protein
MRCTPERNIGLLGVASIRICDLPICGNYSSCAQHRCGLIFHISSECRPTTSGLTHAIGEKASVVRGHVSLLPLRHILLLLLLLLPPPLGRSSVCVLLRSCLCHLMFNGYRVLVATGLVGAGANRRSSQSTCWRHHLCIIRTVHHITDTHATNR